MKELNLCDYEMLDNEIMAISKLVENCNILFNSVGYGQKRDYLSLKLISDLLSDKAKQVYKVVEYSVNLKDENKSLKKQLKEQLKKQGEKK